MQPLSTITSLRPRMDKSGAVAAIEGRGLARAWRHATLGPLRGVAEMYVPFHLYRVTVFKNGERTTRLMAIDAVTATLDPYSFDSVPQGEELVEVNSRNRPPALVSAEECCAKLLAKVERVLFQTGFFKIRKLKLEAELLSTSLHVPYWIGFFGAGAEVRLFVLDAVRGRPEGAKLRVLVRNWLQEQHNQPTTATAASAS